MSSPATEAFARRLTAVTACLVFGFFIHATIDGWARWTGTVLLVFGTIALLGMVAATTTDREGDRP